MNRRLLASLALFLTLGACGTMGLGALNPLNWFGGSHEKRVVALDNSATKAQLPLVKRIISLAIARTPGGAIIQATGLPPTQGYWKPRLVSVPGNKTTTSRTLVYEFRATAPMTPSASGTLPSRELVTGLFISAQKLAQVRTITVIAATNRRTVRR